MAAVLAPLFVAHSRFALAQSKRRSGLNPAVRRDGDHELDSQQEQEVSIDPAQRGMRYGHGSQLYVT